MNPAPSNVDDGTKVVAKKSLAEPLHDMVKELSLCHKLKFSNSYIFETWCCKSLIFYTVGSNNIHSLNIPKVYDIRLQRSKDFKIRVCGKYYLLTIKKIKNFADFIEKNVVDLKKKF